MRRVWWVFLVILLLIGGWFVLRPFVYPAPPAVPVLSPLEIRQQWKDGVTNVLALYDQKQDAKSARDTLLTLRVPVEAKSIHLSLALAFQGFIDQESSARVALERARAEFLRFSP